MSDAMSPPQPAGRRRSGSQKRQKSAAVRVACLPSEQAQLRELAARSGQSLGALCLNALLAVPMPPARRPANDERSAMGRFLHQLGAIKSELGKSGSNLNQMAHHLNAGRDPDTQHVALAVAALIDEQQQAIRKLEELWIACMEAMGRRAG